jgi:hypothetical protein
MEKNSKKELPKPQNDQKDQPKLTQFQKIRNFSIEMGKEIKTRVQQKINRFACFVQKTPK